MLDLPVVISALGLALVALALALSLRATGTFSLEHPVSALLLCLAFAVYIRGGVSSVNPGTLALVATGPILVGELMYRFYRRWRSIRGGDSTSLITSYALMNSLALLSEQFTRGRSFPTRLDFPVEIGATLLFGVIGGVWWLLRQSRVEAQIKLARDSGNLLRTFGVSAKSVYVLTKILSFLLLIAGTAAYLSTRENFSVGRLEILLVPAFAVVLSVSRFSVLRIFLLSLALMLCETYMVFFLGNSVLTKVYQSVLLLAIVILPGVAVGYGKPRGTRTTEQIAH